MLRRHAFTLIELLVVIAIISILAAILFPVFAQAKAAGKKAVCISNTRQTGMALTMYMSDWDDFYPEEHPFTNNPVVDDNNGQLENIDYGSPQDKILPYVGASTDKTMLYVCPMDPDPHGLKLLDAAGNCIGSNPLAPPPGGLTSYILNAYYLFGANSSQIPAPSQSIYISERRDSFCDVHYHPWLGEVEDPVNGTDTTNPVAIEPNRHFNGSTHVFADGHSKWMVFAQARAPFDAQHQLYGMFQAF
jgi:prepilin-type N-terminal cleavage/methylation domain-containing protein